MIQASSSSLTYPLLRASCTQSPLDLPARRSTGCWCCDSSHPPCRCVACSSSSTVQLITAIPTYIRIAASTVCSQAFRVTAFEVDSLVAQDERQRLNGWGRSTQWHTHTVSWTVNQSSAIMTDHSDPGNAICWCWKGWQIKNLFSYSEYLSSIWQQPVTVYETSTYSTHHTRLHTTQVFCIAQTIALSYNHWYLYRYSYRYRRWKKVSGIGSIGKSWYRSQPSMNWPKSPRDSDLQHGIDRLIICMNWPRSNRDSDLQKGIDRLIIYMNWPKSSQVLTTITLQHNH